jgi:protein-tyrosine-phosphatase
VDVLIVSCYGAARGPMAEALMSVLSKGRIRAFDAPILPTHCVHPLAKDLISAIGYKKSVSYEPTNIYDQWQLRGQKADFIFGVCKEAVIVAFGNWPGDPQYMEYLDYEELEPFYGIRADGAQAHIEAKSRACRSAFRRVFEEMATDIREYVVRILTMVDGREFVPASLPPID